MKKVGPCVVENCIPTPTSCSQWNGGDIEYLGIKNGEFLNDIVWEIVTKLKEVTGDQIEDFDIEGLLDLCNQQAPQEVTLISILTLVRDNQICLKDYIDTLSEKLNELFQNQNVDVNLRCYSDFDNLGNNLSINRAQLDQLIIDNLCDHKGRLDTVEGKLIVLQSQVNNLEAVEEIGEPEIATCIDPGVKTISNQIVSVASSHCALQTALGTPANISQALAKTPAAFGTLEYQSLVGWDLSPDNFMQAYGNLLLAFNNLMARVKYMETTCCAMTCEDVKVGFTSVFNEDGDGIILKFTQGAGTLIPDGFVDKGSTGTITDVDGNVESFSLAIHNDLEEEVFILGLNLNEPLEIDLKVKIGNDVFTCDKCIHKKVITAGCGYCEISVTGEEGSSVTILYED